MWSRADWVDLWLLRLDVLWLRLELLDSCCVWRCQLGLGRDDMGYRREEGGDKCGDPSTCDIAGEREMEGKGKGHYHRVQQEKSSDLIGLCVCNNMQHRLISYKTIVFK